MKKGQSNKKLRLSPNMIQLGLRTHLWPVTKLLMIPPPGLTSKKGC